MGFVYLVAFYVAARQLVPLVGANGLTPATALFPSGERAVRRFAGRFSSSSVIFWFELLGHDGCASFPGSAWCFRASCWPATPTR
jgi:hypothetical protein